jgi:dihydrofolate reductase/thymidylate synthase
VDPTTGIRFEKRRSVITNPDGSIVVAMDEQRGIGKNGVLPWHLPADLKHFARITKTTQTPGAQNAVLMGRKTWESLPESFKPLPGRLNIILSRQKDHDLPHGVLLADSLDEALRKANQANVEQLFVIGGGRIFEEALPHPQCEKLYITQLKGEFGCDTFLPEWDDAHFEKVEESPLQSENGIQFRFVIYKRRSSA